MIVHRHGSNAGYNIVMALYREHELGYIPQT